MGVRTLVAVGILALTSISAWPGHAGTDAVHEVDVHNFFFDPDTITINAHDTLRWVWVSGFHSVETLDGSEEWCAAQSAGTCDKVFDMVGTYDYRCGLHPNTMIAEIIVVGVAPIVTITAPAPSEVVSGQITVTGTATHPDGVTGVEVWLDSFPRMQAQVTGNTWSATLDTTDFGNGGHTLHAEATGGDGETGSTSIAIVIGNPATIDLAIGEYDAGFGAVGGAPLSARIDNAGNVALSNVDVRFDYHYQGQWITITTESIEVAAFSAALVEVHWDGLTTFGDFDTRVTVDPDGEFSETNEGNNEAFDTATFWITGIDGIDLADPL